MKEEKLKKVKFLSIKEIAYMCDCSERKAFQLRKDIAEHFGVFPRFVSLGHFNEYFKIS